MKSKTKKVVIIVTSVVLALLAIVAIVAIVVNVNRPKIKTETKVALTSKYWTDRVEGSVTGKYYVDPGDDTEPVGKDMTTEDGKTTLEFNAEDTISSSKFLIPQEDIKNDLSNGHTILLEYYFRNKTANTYDVALTFNGILNNVSIVSIDFDGSDRFDIWAYGVSNGTTGVATIPNNLEHDGLRYISIELSVNYPEIDYEIDGSFNWSITAKGATLDKLQFVDVEDHYAVKAASSDIAGKVIIPATYAGKPVTEIPANGFYNKDQITDFTLPEGLTKIGSKAIYGCNSLSKLTIPSTVTEIGVIGSCALLETISCSAIGMRVDMDTSSGGFSNCPNLKKCYYYGTLKQWCEDESVIYSALRPGIALYINSTKIADPLEIPSDVTKIGYGAFNYLDGITSVTIPANVEEIGGAAFAGCPNLTTIKVDDGNANYTSKNEAGEECNVIIDKTPGAVIILQGCNNSIIPTDKDLIGIGDHAFAHCTGLTKLVIPDNINMLGMGAFMGCTGITSITVGSKPLNCGQNSFKGCTNLKEVINNRTDGVIVGFGELIDPLVVGGIIKSKTKINFDDDERKDNYIESETQQDGYWVYTKIK